MLPILLTCTACRSGQSGVEAQSASSPSPQNSSAEVGTTSKVEGGQEARDLPRHDPPDPNAHQASASQPAEGPKQFPNEVLDTIEIMKAPWPVVFGLAAGEGAVWTSNTGAFSISRIDATTRKMTHVIPFGKDEAPAGIVVGHGSVWVALYDMMNLQGPDKGKVARIDPATRQIVSRIVVGAKAERIAATDDAIWVVASSPGTTPATYEKFLVKIDPRTNAVADRIPAQGAGSFAIGFGSLWTSEDRLVRRIDIKEKTETAKVRVEQYAGDIVFGNDAVWVFSGTAESGKVWRIDPSTNRLNGEVDVCASPSGIAFEPGAVWIACNVDGTVMRIDPETVKVAGRVSVGAIPSQVAIGEGSLWVLLSGSNSIARLGP